MTYEHLAGEHPSDEQLSMLSDAVSDGERDDAMEAIPPSLAHVASCERCEQRLAELDAARLLLGTPLEPVASDQRAAAVANVLRRAGLTDPVGPPRVPHAAPRRVPHAPPVVRYEDSHRARVWVATGVAVGGLVLALVVPLALVAHTTSPTSSSAGPARSGQPPAKTAHQPAGASANASAPPVPDVGNVASPHELRSRLDALRTAQDNSAQGAGRPAYGASSPASAISCAVAAQRAVGDAGAFQFEVTADYAGTPAVVYLFGPVTPTSSGANPPTVAVALAAANCRVLAKTAL